MSSMRALGVESTAHTFGLGVAEIDSKTGKNSITQNRSISYRPEKEGIIPSDCARFLRENAPKLLDSLGGAQAVQDVDIIGVSQGPGMPPSLSVGLEFAKSLSETLGKPLVGINHCRAHIEVGRFLLPVTDPIVLYVSGGNTQVVYADEDFSYRILGETQDVGIGNAIDKLGRAMGIKFPAGPKMEELAKSGEFLMLPYSVKGMDMNFSGILTDATRKYQKMAREGSEKAARQNICHSFQEVTFAMLTEVTERAMAAMNKKELLLVGGVAQNQRLQKMLGCMCKERDSKLFVVPREYSGDNGAMIAVSALLAARKGNLTPPKDIRPHWRLDVK